MVIGELGYVISKTVCNDVVIKSRVKGLKLTSQGRCSRVGSVRAPFLIMSGTRVAPREHEAVNHCIGRASLAINHCPPVQNVTSLIEGAFR